MSGNEPARWQLICLVAAALFLALAATVAAVGILPGDVAVRDGVLAAVSPGFTPVARWVNSGGSWQGILPALVLLLALSREARRRWWLWCAVLLVTGGVETGFKHLVGRPRPEELSMGFPSGHATGIATFAVIMIYLVGRERIDGRRRTGLQGLALFAILLVGLARIVLRAHWPSDVVAGWALGTACAAAAAWWDAATDATAAVTRSRPAGLPGVGRR